MTYYIGIDNSSLDHKVHIVDNDGNFHSQFVIKNNLNGFNNLHEVIRNFNDFMIGFETPHGPLAEYLKEKELTVHSLNPLKIKRFKETATISGNKNDNIDAAAIAEYMRKNSGQCRSLIYNSAEVEKLKMLCAIHKRMTEENARYKNKLHFSVRQYFCLQESLFTDFGCTVQLKMIMKYPTFRDLKKADENELESFLKSNRYCLPKHIKKIIDQIKSYDQIISEDTEYVCSLEVKMLCAILLEIRQKLNEVEKEMKGILDRHQLGKVFRSIPGAGTILSSNLLALFGDKPERFDNPNQVQCLFGTAPRNYQSGNYHKVLMRKACNKNARCVLYLFAFASLNYNPWARAYYDEQRAKGKTHSIALRALSNKWINIIYRLWKDEIIYQEDKKITAVA
jgi:transposase